MTQTLIVLVTGATGFVGRHLLEELSHRADIRTLAVTRGACPADAPGLNWMGRSALEGWIQAGGRIDIVIHLAARAHILKDQASDQIGEFRRANVDETMKLAELALRAGARRFLLVSSIGVNGNATDGRPFTEGDLPDPVEPYACSKLEAEQALFRFSQRSSMPVTVVRPPLVYGPGAPGNFARLLRLAQSKVPLPLAGVRNLRSFVGVQNLCHFLVEASLHPQAAGELFLISDGEDVSTADLLRQLAAGAGRPSRLFSAPVSLLRAGARLLGQGNAFEKLCGSLQVDSSKARRVLQWQPPMTLGQGLQAWARSERPKH